MPSEVHRLFNEQLGVFESARRKMLVENADVIDSFGGGNWAKKHVKHSVLTCEECLRFTHVYLKERDGVRHT